MVLLEQRGDRGTRGERVGMGTEDGGVTTGMGIWIGGLEVLIGIGIWIVKDEGRMGKEPEVVVGSCSSREADFKEV